MYDIWIEAQDKLAKEKLNLGNLAQYYTGLVDDTGKERNYEIFDMPEITKCYKLLFDNVLEMDWKDLYKYRPEYVSNLLYGTPSYDYLVLYANRISDKRKFVSKYMTNRKIKYFKKDIIDTIMSSVEDNSNKSGIPINMENNILYEI